MIDEISRFALHQTFRIRREEFLERTLEGLWYHVESERIVGLFLLFAAIGRHGYWERFFSI
jgi:hypothetical protein